MKKLLLFTSIIVLTTLNIYAQDFTLIADTAFTFTSRYNTDIIKTHNYITNKTASPLIVNWQILEKTFPSTEWTLEQLCDNKGCRSSTSPSLVSFTIDQTDSISPMEKSILEPRLKIPINAANGIGILRVNLTTVNTTKIATYIINKTPTGIAVISSTDTRVNIYPNPANSNIIVYAEKSLNPANVSFISVTGQVIYSILFNKAKEAETINISMLPQGTYMIRLTDEKGQLVTSRKFIKE